MKISDLFFVAPQVRLELTTLRLTAECSAIELLRNIVPGLLRSNTIHYIIVLFFCQQFTMIFLLF